MLSSTKRLTTTTCCEGHISFMSLFPSAFAPVSPILLQLLLLATPLLLWLILDNMKASWGIGMLENMDVGCGSPEVPATGIIGLDLKPFPCTSGPESRIKPERATPSPRFRLWEPPSAWKGDEGEGEGGNFPGIGNGNVPSCSLRWCNGAYGG